MKTFCFQLTNTIHLIPFASEELSEALKDNNLPCVEIDLPLPSAHTVLRVLNNTYGSSENPEELCALRDKLESCQFQEISSKGYLKGFAYLDKLQGEDHRAYLLEVLEVLRWKNVLVGVDSEGRVSLEGEKQLHTLVNVEEDGVNLMLTLVRSTDLESRVHSVPWDMATELPGLWFEHRHFLSNPVAKWKWFNVRYQEELRTESDHTETIVD